MAMDSRNELPKLPLSCGVLVSGILLWDIKESATYQTFPWIFVQEAKHDIKRGPSPRFEAVGVFVGMAHVFGYGGQVSGAHAGCEKRLLSVAPCRVCYQRLGVCSHLSRKRARAVAEKNGAPPIAARMLCRDVLSSGLVGQFPDGNTSCQSWWLLRHFIRNSSLKSARVFPPLDLECGSHSLQHLPGSAAHLVRAHCGRLAQTTLMCRRQTRSSSYRCGPPVAPEVGPRSEHWSGCPECPARSTPGSPC